MRALTPLFCLENHLARAPAPKPKPTCPKGCLFLDYESASTDGRGTWFARVPAEHTIEDVLSPAYFYVTQKDKGVREGDIIEIEPESALWIIRTRVMLINEDLGEVELREHENLRQTYEVEAPSGFAFKWEGGDARWTVWKGESKVGAGYATQSAALGRVRDLTSDRAAA